MGCMLGQLSKLDKKEKAIYYFSKKFISCEINYITIEKTCAYLPQAHNQKYVSHLIPKFTKGKVASPRHQVESISEMC